MEEVREAEGTPASKDGMSEGAQLAAADLEAEGVPLQFETWESTGSGTLRLDPSLLPEKVAPETPKLREWLLLELEPLPDDLLP